MHAYGRGDLGFRCHREHRRHRLRPGAPRLAGRARARLTALAFQVASPALLFSTLARADLSVLVSVPMLVTGLSTFVVAGTFIAVGAVRRWSVGRTTIGALCAGYVNAGNLGIPVAMYVLGDASLIAPVLLFQQSSCPRSP